MDGESACTQHRHHPRRELSRADICVRIRVNPYVAPRHVIARYCAITLHLAVVQMHRGPIGETPRARKVRLSSLIYIFRPKSIVPRPENSNSRLFVRRGAWISSFFSWTTTHVMVSASSCERYFVEIVSTIRFFRLTYQLICHRWNSCCWIICAKLEEISADLFDRCLDL